MDTVTVMFKVLLCSRLHIDYTPLGCHMAAGNKQVIAILLRRIGPTENNNWLAHGSEEAPWLELKGGESRWVGS